jgi:hypothetical protein
MMTGSQARTTSGQSPAFDLAETSAVGTGECSR